MNPTPIIHGYTATMSSLRWQSRIRRFVRSRMFHFLCYAALPLYWLTRAKQRSILLAPLATIIAVAGTATA